MQIGTLMTEGVGRCDNVALTSMQLVYVSLTSVRRHVPAGKDFYQTKHLDNDTISLRFKSILK